MSESNRLFLRYCVCVTVLFGGLLSVSGCGYRRPATVKTSGRVTLDGEPVAEAALMFVGSTGRPSSANTDANGEFKVTTYGRNDGLAPGEYKVSVAQFVLLPKYQERYDAAQERARQEAEQSGDDEVEDVEMAFPDSAYTNGLPEKYAEIETTDISVTIDKSTRDEPLLIELTSESEEK